MRILYSFVCDHAEPQDNRLDVHGMFHELFAPGFPAAHQMVYVLGVEWDVEEPGRKDFKIDLLDPGGAPSFTIQGHTEVSLRRQGDPPPRTVLILPVQEVRFPTEGTYFFQLQVDDVVQTVSPLHLLKLDEGAELLEASVPARGGAGKGSSRPPQARRGGPAGPPRGSGRRGG